MKKAAIELLDKLHELPELPEIGQEVCNLKRKLNYGKSKNT